MSFGAVKDTIAQKIRALLQNTHSLSAQKVLRLEVQSPELNLLDWVSSQIDNSKIYWLSRDNSFEMAGIGRADMVYSNSCSSYDKPFSAILEKLPRDTSVHYYGGIDFYPPAKKTDATYRRRKEKEWKSFGAYCFLLPQFEIVKRKGKPFLACNILTHDITKSLIKKYLKALENISFSRAPRSVPIPQIHAFSLFPNIKEWQVLFKEHIQPSGKMAYKKIVLAQKTAIEFASKVSPLEVFRKLTHQAHGSFHYYFQPQKNCAFFGASPERLFKRQGARIESEALAGTRPRGKTSEEDAYYEKILRDSPKDALEHKIVVKSIKDTFQRLCARWKADNLPSVTKASSAHHLITRFWGTLKDTVDDAQILTALHPTPAVGGIPRNQALNTIVKFEPFDRGWYAGPIGYIGRDTVDFAVALRCALMQDRYINLYAGAGIVEGSSADEEWREIEQKKSIFFNLFKKH